VALVVKSLEIHTKQKSLKLTCAVSWYTFIVALYNTWYDIAIMLDRGIICYGVPVVNWNMSCTPLQSMVKVAYKHLEKSKIFRGWDFTQPSVIV
jgi:hypothetical protein